MSALAGKRLQGLGLQVAGLARNDREAQVLRAEGLTPLVAAPTDPKALRRALRGVQRVLLEGRPRPGQAVLHRRIIDAAGKAGVSHVVRLSPYGASPDSASMYLRRQAAVDAALEEAPLRTTILRHHLYTQDLLAFARQAREEHRIAACLGGGKPAYVDARDVAQVAVAALGRTSLRHETYVVTGPHAVSLDELAAMIGRVGHASIHAHDVPPEEMRALLEDEPEHVVDARIGVYQAYADAAPTQTVQRLTGLSPRTVEGFVLEHAARFTPPHRAPAWILAERDMVRSLSRPLSW